MLLLSFFFSFLHLTIGCCHLIPVHKSILNQLDFFVWCVWWAISVSESIQKFSITRNFLLCLYINKIILSSLKIPTQPTILCEYRVIFLTGMNYACVCWIMYGLMCVLTNLRRWLRTWVMAMTTMMRIVSGYFLDWIGSFGYWNYKKTNPWSVLCYINSKF